MHAPYVLLSLYLSKEIFPELIPKKVSIVIFGILYDDGGDA